MLTLTCEMGESVMIGDDIVVTVVGFRKRAIQLSFDAPREIPINREKVYNKIRDREKEEKRDTRLDPSVRPVRQ